MSPLLKSLPRLVRPNVRFFTRGEVRKVEAKVVEEIKSRQSAYQTGDDEPVHIKSGKIHYYVTTAVGVLAFAGTIHGLYKMIEH